MKNIDTEVIDKNFYCMSRETYLKMQRAQVMRNLRLLRNALKPRIKRSDLFPPENYDKHYFEDMENLDKR